MRYHLIVYVPYEHAPNIRSVLSKCGAGQIGSYDSCSFSTRGIGRFRPLKGADPAIGKVGKLEAVEEEKIEVVIESGVNIQVLVKKLRDAHPYEQPAIHVLPIVDENSL